MPNTSPTRAQAEPALWTHEKGAPRVSGSCQTSCPRPPFPIHPSCQPSGKCSGHASGWKPVLAPCTQGRACMLELGISSLHLFCSSPHSSLVTSHDSGLDCSFFSRHQPRFLVYHHMLTFQGSASASPGKYNKDTLVRNTVTNSNHGLLQFQQRWAAPDLQVPTSLPLSTWPC